MTAALRLRGLEVRLPRAAAGTMRTVLRGLDLEIAPGEALGLVGGSGCGKTTCARASLGLIPPSAGTVEVAGRDLATMARRDLRSFRRHMQMVFQDPGGSLNGRMRAGDLVAEPMLVHGLASPKQAEAAAIALLEQCGLDGSDAGKWPHQFSGGQRQRIGIARALASNPSLLVCDEPTSSLDVSVQARILNLLDRLRAERGLAMLLITHDLAVARHVCDRIAVMDDGRIVEEGDAATVVDRPVHAVTQRLVEALAV
ncbi:MAG: dipeptide/oligopeptide/nickel ABC transporter ATP-binding protein [Phycisphaerales bacterium]|jgi:ABC-type glutathione transport system ATPase component|nr:dipeptide/oligopeptide/nickel ABC transporter ATP-binding protein [Phycisphaerales bacterium]